jgi:uncharacterized protein YbjT (DUF2867 family)
MRVLVLGGYGLVGAEIMRACAAAGFECIGLGRCAATGARLVPDALWIGADMARLISPEGWSPHLNGVGAIVNAAGALQDGARDGLEAVHHRAIAALIVAAQQAGVKSFVQISAPGAAASASTRFLRTKAAGDAAVRVSSLDWIVLKPGLVIARGAYGGTALVRMLAAMPVATPLIHPTARVQTVAIDDVARAVVSALNGEVPRRRDFDLVEDAPHSLRDIVRGFRKHLGFAPSSNEPDLPAWMAAPVALGADIAGALGWRSPLRSTALKVMGENVLGDPGPWKAATGQSLRTFEETLASLPSTAQERLFARAQLAVPAMLLTLAIFWLASGVITLFQLDRASALLPDVGRPLSLALAGGGAVLDIAIGAMLLVRRTARFAAVASVAVAAAYLIAGTLLAPQIWSDPLGAYVKVFPAIALGFAVALLLEKR